MHRPACRDAWLLVWLAAVPLASARAADVALTVTEPAGVARTAWPVASGVPFPRGALPSAAACRLLDAGGQEVPLQARALATWDDGSVRWLLADFAADVAAGGTAAYVLEYGTGVARAAFASPLEVDDAGAAVAVTTGPLVFAVPRDAPVLLDDVVLNGIPMSAGGLAARVEYDTASGPALPPDEVVVEEAGPLRAQIRLRGSHERHFGYDVRIDAWAGSPVVRVLYTFVNERDPLYTAVTSVALHLPTALGGPARFALGGDASVVAGPVVGGVALVQAGGAQQEPDPPVAEPSFTVGGDAVAAGARAAGWADLGDGTRGVTAVVRDFWQEYPKSFVLDDGLLSVGLWAGEAGVPLVSGSGMAKTSEVFYYFHAGDHEAAGAADVARALEAPLVAVAPAAWIRDTGALPGTLAGVTPRDAGFLARLAARYASYETLVEEENFYGLVNWGDWHFGENGEWANLEYDLGQALALAFASTGEPRYLDGLRIAAHHFADVDVIHYSDPHAPWVGFVHRHKPLHFCWDCGAGIDLGHVWTGGLVAHWYLTGDARSLEAARGMADYLVARLDGIGDKNPRQWGWPMIALDAVYEATGDPVYLDSLGAWAAAALADPGTSTPRPDPCAPDVDHDRCWKLGIMADGLARHHRRSGDPAARAWLLAYADTLVAEAAACGEVDVRYLPALAYAYALEGTPAYRTLVEAGLAATPTTAFPKALAYEANATFRAYTLLDEDTAATTTTTSAATTTTTSTAPPATTTSAPGTTTTTAPGTTTTTAPTATTTTLPPPTTTTLPPGAPVHDPGFAYVDGDRDGRFSPALAGSVDFGPGQGVTIGGDFDATALYPGAGIVVPPGGSISRHGPIALRAAGTIVVTGTLDATKKNAGVTLESTAGDVVLRHAAAPGLAGAVAARGDVVVEAAGVVDLGTAVLATESTGDVALVAGGSVDLRDTAIVVGSRGEVFVCAGPGAAVLVDGATLGDGDGVDVAPAGVTVVGTPAAGTVNPPAGTCGEGGGSTTTVPASTTSTTVSGSTTTTGGPASTTTTGPPPTTTTTVPPAGVHDPGFAYVDGNGDGRFSPALAGSVDFGPAEGVAITGDFDATATHPGAGVVIPPGGSIASQRDVTVRADGPVVVTGTIATSRKNAGVALESAAGDVRLGHAAAPAHAGTIDARGDVIVEAAGTIDAGGATFVTEGTGDLHLAAAGDVDLRAATLSVEARGDVVVCAGGTLLLDGAVLDDGDGIDVAPAGVAVVGTPAAGSTNPPLAVCP